MDMKKAKINNNFVSVISLDAYRSNPDIYDTNCTAIEFEDLGVVLPIIGKTDKSVGVAVSPSSLFCRVNMPDDKSLPDYSTDNIIDLSKTKDMAELMRQQEVIKDIEYDMLTTVDNVFQPKIGENCSPAMKALKTAVNEKGIDINKYAYRFGSNFNNDKRQYNKDTISMQMLERQCNGLDIKATLILEDASDDVPNPIGHKIVVELTEGGDSE